MLNAPLNQRSLSDINKALAALAEAYKQIDAAEQAGIDVAEQKAVHDYYQERLTAIKQTYFPSSK